MHTYTYIHTDVRSGVLAVCRGMDSPPFAVIVLDSGSLNLVRNRSSDVCRIASTTPGALVRMWILSQGMLCHTPDKHFSLPSRNVPDEKRNYLRHGRTRRPSLQERRHRGRATKRGVLMSINTDSAKKPSGRDAEVHKSSGTSASSVANFPPTFDIDSRANELLRHFACVTLSHRRRTDISSEHLVSSLWS